ncbi:MAG: hypothetical protein M1132_04790 [Chloroflexi bacterium]|nr:hypothetical protein [Chloroflexota bacterium]
MLPRWADLTYFITENPDVLVIVELNQGSELCWLQVSGVASLVLHPDWGNLLPQRVSHIDPNDLFSFVHIKPRRIDLVDENSGWGVCETLELGPPL